MGFEALWRAVLLVFVGRIPEDNDIPSVKVMDGVFYESNMERYSDCRE